MMPRISLVAYEDRNPAFLFVAVPNLRGRYVRTDKCVAFVGCPVCHSTVGEPCKAAGGDGYGGTTHFKRRLAARSFWGHQAHDVIEQAPAVQHLPSEDTEGGEQ